MRVFSGPGVWYRITSDPITVTRIRRQQTMTTTTAFFSIACCTSGVSNVKNGYIAAIMHVHGHHHSWEYESKQTVLCWQDCRAKVKETALHSINICYNVFTDMSCVYIILWMFWWMLCKQWCVSLHSHQGVSKCTIIRKINCAQCVILDCKVPAESCMCLFKLNLLYFSLACISAELSLVPSCATEIFVGSLVNKFF